MSLDHGSRCDENQRPFPSRPQPSQNNPEEFVHGRQSMLGTFVLQREELLAQGEILKDESLTRTAGAD